jgi:hypothetical protein
MFPRPTVKGECRERGGAHRLLASRCSCSRPLGEAAQTHTRPIVLATRNAPLFAGGSASVLSQEHCAGVVAHRLTELSSSAEIDDGAIASPVYIVVQQL